MSDLYGTDDRDRSSFEPDSGPGTEHEDMSLFLHNLLHNSPATVSTAATAGISPLCRSATLEYRRSTSLINSSGANFNFSDPGGFIRGEAKERVDKSFSLAAVGDSDAVTSSMKRGEFSTGNKGCEASDAAANQAQPGSSKRSRSAEVHNLSEKRRRSRINEKLKALQNLIPNSNKTDKASMLDEAIEYLKQLQLQVQMLTMRNGLDFHPNNIPGSLPSMQLPMDFTEENVMPNTCRGADTLSNNQETMMQPVFGTPVMPNTCRGADTLSNNQETMMQPVFGISNPKFSGQQLSMASVINNSSSAFSFGLESSIQNNYEIPHHLARAKDICREGTLLHLPLDISCSGNHSSSDVSL